MTPRPSWTRKAISGVFVSGASWSTVGSGHLPDEIDRRGSDALSAGFPRPTLPAPEQTKALPVPVDHRVRLDQSNRLAPPTPNPREPNPENAIDRVESSSLGLSAQDQELVTQGNILQEQITPRFDSCSGETNHETKPPEHAPQSSRKRP